MESPRNLHLDEFVADSEDEDILNVSQDGIRGFNRTLAFNASTDQLPIQPQRLQALANVVSPAKPFADSIEMPPSSIADRAKMRQRNVKSTLTESISSFSPTKRSCISTDVFELSSGNEDELYLQPSVPSKQKQKQNAKPKVKSKQTTPGTSSSAGAPEARATTTTAKTATTPKPKPRPKPRPLPRRVVSKEPSPLPESENTIPVLPSSIPMHGYVHSSLPPSDFPLPTSEYIPRIETLPSQGTDFDAPPTSPSSLFDGSGFINNSKRRKRAHRLIDELDSSDDNAHEINTSKAGTNVDHDIDTARMLPPPTFFAGSSSSTDGQTSAPAQAPVEVVDLTLVSTLDFNADSASTKDGKKQKKPRKKKGELQSEQGALDGQSGRGKKTPAKTKKASSKKQQVEVLIVSSSKGSAKGKEKENQVFKSKEFIDSEDDVDMPRATPVGESSRKSAAKPDSITSLSSLPNSDADACKPPEASSRKKRKSILGDCEDDDDEINLIAGPKKKLKGKQKGVVGKSDDGGVLPSSSKKSQAKSKVKGKGRNIVLSDEDEDSAPQHEDSAIHVSTGSEKVSKRNEESNKKKKAENKGVDEPESEQALLSETSLDPAEIKENIQPIPSRNPTDLQTGKLDVKEQLFPSLSSRYTIAPKTKQTPMSELIRRVNSLPGSPFQSSRAPSSSTVHKRTSIPGTAYSPYLKASRSALSRIASLHPSRRTPPPPLPPPPPRKKTKKELEMEERWEEELVESVGGITEWACMTDEERKEMRRLKREREMFGWED